MLFMAWPFEGYYMPFDKIYAVCDIFFSKDVPGIALLCQKYKNLDRGTVKNIHF